MYVLPDSSAKYTSKPLLLSKLKPVPSASLITGNLITFFSHVLAVLTVNALVILTS